MPISIHILKTYKQSSQKLYILFYGGIGIAIIYGAEFGAYLAYMKPFWAKGIIARYTLTYSLFRGSILRVATGWFLCYLGYIFVNYIKYIFLIKIMLVTLGWKGGEGQIEQSTTWMDTRVLIPNKASKVLPRRKMSQQTPKLPAKYPTSSKTTSKQISPQAREQVANKQVYW